VYRATKILDNVLIIIHLNNFIMNCTTCYDCVHCAPVYDKKMGKKSLPIEIGQYCELHNKYVSDSSSSCDQFSSLEI